MAAMPPPAPTMAPVVGAPPGVPQPPVAMPPPVPGQHPVAQMPMAPQQPTMGVVVPAPGQQPAPQPQFQAAVPPPVAPQPMAAVPPPGQPAAPSTAPIVLIKNDPARTWGVTAPRTTGNGKPATRRLKTEILEDQAWESAGKPANLPAMTLAEAQAAGYQVDLGTMIVVGASNPAPQAPPMAPPAQPMAPQPMAPPAPQAPPAAAPMAPPLPMASVPAPQTQMAPPAQAATAQQDATGATLRELSKTITELKRQNAVLDMALSIVLRMNPDLKAALNSQGVASCEEVLKELNLPVPQ